MEIGRNRVLPLLYLTARAFLGGYTVALLGNIVGTKVCTCKENTVDSNEPTVFILVEDGGLEPSTSAM